MQFPRNTFTLFLAISLVASSHAEPQGPVDAVVPEAPQGPEKTLARAAGSLIEAGAQQMSPPDGGSSTTSETGVDTYELVACPAAGPALQNKINTRPEQALWSQHSLGGKQDSLPWPMDETPNIGGLIGMFVNPATRKKVVLTHGNTSYAEGRLPSSPIKGSDAFNVASVTKMLTGTVFLHYHRDLLDEPVIDTCALACGVPQNFIDTFLSGDNSNITYSELINHTSGLPNYFEDSGDTGSQSMNPFAARMINDGTYMAPEDILKFSAANFPSKQRGVYHYSNEAYVLLGMAVEYLQQERLSVLVTKLFDDYVPCTQDLTCGLRFEADMPAWKAIETSDPGPRTAVEVRAGITPVSNYYLLNGQWYDLSTADQSVPGNTFARNFFQQGEQSRWATAGAMCSAASLANFMIALSQGSIPNVRATDWWMSGDKTGSPGLLGQAGACGAGGWFDPRESRGIVVAGVTNIEPNNDGIKGLYKGALAALSDCLDGTVGGEAEVVMPSCQERNDSPPSCTGDPQCINLCITNLDANAMAAYGITDCGSDVYCNGGVCATRGSDNSPQCGSDCGGGHPCQYCDNSGCCTSDPEGAHCIAENPSATVVCGN